MERRRIKPSLNRYTGSVRIAQTRTITTRGADSNAEIIVAFNHIAIDDGLHYNSRRDRLREL